MIDGISILIFYIPVSAIQILIKTCESLNINLYINLAWVSVCLFGCLFVCLYPINVKTAEPIRPEFFVGHHVTPGKVYEW